MLAKSMVTNVIFTSIDSTRNYVDSDSVINTPNVIVATNSEYFIV